MRTELALKHIENRVKERGWKNVEMNLRHVRLLPSSKTTFTIGSDMWVLIEEELLRNASGTYQFPASPIRIESNNGVFDVLDNKVHEQEHEHTGKMEITNKVNRILFVMFLQITPKRRCKHGKKN
ncbi:MAG: hypothetical protein ACOZCO_05200 [Bacteroidota bacterium]